MAAAVFSGMADVFAGVLGEPVTVTPAAGTARTVAAVMMHQPVVAFDGEADHGVESHTLQAHLTAADAAGLDHGATVTHLGEVYTVTRVDPLPTGMVALTLRLV